MTEPCVSVIVPSYNRAALLGRTLPSYLQPETGELILVDDCSTDDTARVVSELAAADPRIRYIRSERNLKQTHAKNMGIAVARYPFVYFGDDDSLLSLGALGILLETGMRMGADIVGARAPYMETEEDARDPEAFARRQAPWDGALVDPFSLRVRFDRPTRGPVPAPFVHAAFLARRELAARIRFDEEYVGNCYREETDFLVRAAFAGAKIVFEPHAVQMNLPRSSSAGGAHGSATEASFAAFVRGKMRYFSDVLRNNWRFLKKNRAALDFVLGVHYPDVLRQACLAWDVLAVIASYPIRKVFKRGH